MAYNDGIPIGAIAAPGSNDGIPAAQPLYASLTAQSTPAQIAAAYSQFVGGAGGDTAANQTQAVNFLTGLGITAPTIETAYNQFLQPAQVANTAGMGTQGIGLDFSSQSVAPDFSMGLPTTQNQNLATTTTLPMTSGAITAPPVVLPPPTYDGLTSASTAEDIARAYYRFTGEAGGDTKANQDTARTFLERLGIATPTITEAYKDYNELAGLKSSFGAQDAQGAPTAEGILSGFKYANTSGISEGDMKRVLGEDVFNTYKTGLADFAKTGIANILADDKLSFDEARTAVKFGRDLGYDTQKLADLTGTNKKVFDAIYKNYDDTTNKIVDSALAAEDVKTNDDKIVKALALQKQFGFTDEDLAKAAGFTPAQVKQFLDPVRNFPTEFNKVFGNTDSTAAEVKKTIADAKSNGAIAKLYGTNLDTLDAKIAEIEDRWKGFKNVEPLHAQRIYDQIGGQREKLGNQYYRGTFGDPLKMAATLAEKGIDTLADIGQKEKFETVPAEKRFFTEDGMQVFDLGNGTFGVPDAEGGAAFTVPKSEVKTEYGRLESVLRSGQDGDYYKSEFVPISEKELDKDGNYQQLVGKVAIDKDTGKEISDLNGTIASQKSGGLFSRKENDLNVQFTKEGVPVVYSTQERTGLGALVQDLAPMISMALPFILPGVGSALSSSLAGMGGSALATGTLANAALTQGVISGGLGALGGQDVGKSFLSGAVSPVIGAGISNLLPTGIDPALARTLTSAGTGAVRGALQGGDFKDLLAGGITSGLADYGVNTALGASGLTPQQLNFATGIVAPLLQGNKITPATAFGTLVNASQQMQRTR